MRTLLLWPLWALSTWAQEPPAPGDLVVSPARLIFQGRTRTLECQLTNRGHHTATYRLGFQKLAMGEDGHLHPVTALSRSAEPYLKYTPRQVTLAPGERQVARLILRKPEHLEDGDHRIHLQFQAVPPPAPSAAPNPSTTATNIQLVAIPAISVPVHILHGQVTRSFALQTLSIESEALVFYVRMTGNTTLSGCLQISYQKNDHQTPYPIGRIDDFVHYSDLPAQRVILPLKNPIPDAHGTLWVSLLDEDGKVQCSASVPTSLIHRSRT